MHVSVVPVVVGALIALAFAAACLWQRRQARERRRWDGQWDELVRAQTVLDRELDEVDRQFGG